MPIPAEVALGAKIELARRNLWRYCNLKAPDFYKPDREYLKVLCNELQDFYFNPDERVMIVSAPPRHGKSRTASCFEEWVYGQNPAEKIMTGSYNEILSTTFSKQVRDTIQETKADPSRVVYSDIFPQLHIKSGDGARDRWSLEGQHSSFLATSPGGTSTGFGATLVVIDDLIKNAKEALNENNLDAQWTWFTDTMMSRTEEGFKIIIIMTRWASRDLAGRAKEHFESIGWPVRELVFKALQDDGTMLCSEVLSYGDYKAKMATASEEIASANYQQIPIDLKGCLYGKFKEYDSLPVDDKGNSIALGIYSYTDTADEGSDYLSSFAFELHQGGYAYIVDVMYTQEGMEVTEPGMADFLGRNKVNTARIESNNGGKAFARHVRQIAEQNGNYLTVIKWFFQSKNKRARILANSAWIMEHVLFPRGWRHRWPDLYRDLKAYQKAGKNAHDDAPDALTGVAETVYLLTR